MIFNKLSLLVCFALGFLVVSATCYAAGNELRFHPYYMIPGDGDTWDSAYGVEAQYVIWNTPQMGIALAGGIGSWLVNTDIISGYEDGYGYAMKPSGSAMTFPLGASVLYRPTTGGTSEINLEAGFRYVFVDSNIDFDAAMSDGYDIYTGSDSVDIDGGLVGLLGADIAFPMSPTASIGFGIGYQFDLSKGSASVSGVDLGDNEFKAFYLRAGYTAKF